MDSYVTEKNLNQKTKSVIDKYLEKEHSKLSIFVINKDKSWILNFDQDLKTKTDVKNDKYDIGSLSKTMTSLFVLHTIKNNKLNFDDTVDKYLNLK